jgi:hypothetical protein
LGVWAKPWATWSASEDKGGEGRKWNVGIEKPKGRQMLEKWVLSFGLEGKNLRYGSDKHELKRLLSFFLFGPQQRGPDGAQQQQPHHAQRNQHGQLEVEVLAQEIFGQ